MEKTLPPYPIYLYPTTRNGTLMTTIVSSHQKSKKVFQKLTSDYIWSEVWGIDGCRVALHHSINHNVNDDHTLRNNQYWLVFEGFHRRHYK